MSSPRFKPCDFSIEPDAYGRARSVEWVTVDDAGQDRLRAARMQHEYAYVIRMRALNEYGSIKHYAQVAGIDYQRITQVLRGRQIMRLEDIALADRVLGNVWNQPQLEGPRNESVPHVLG